MRKNLLKITLFFILVLISCSSTNVRSKSRIGKNFFWKVESKTATVYLLGSIHLATKEIYPLDTIIEKAYEESDYLVVEANPKTINPQLLMKKCLYQGNNTLEENVSKETYEQFERIFKKHNLPPLSYKKFKPWFAVVTVLQLELASRGYDQQYGIDMHFLNRASSKKNILELETTEEQFDILENAYSKFPDDFIRYNLKDLEEKPETMDSLVKIWLNGDDKEMEKYINDEMKLSPQFEQVNKILNDDRNEKMVKKIKEYLKSEGTYFVIVGAAHLIGNNSIINKL